MHTIATTHHMTEQRFAFFPADQTDTAFFHINSAYPLDKGLSFGADREAKESPSSPTTYATHASRVHSKMAGITPLPKLSASRSRSEFFRHLGLSEHSDGDKRIYQMMMEEAAAGRARTCQSLHNLTPQSRASKPPYSASQITETAKHREVQNIYVSSSADTRAIYDRGVSYEGTNWDNWVIRWCLWHVFRYRDDRNRNRGAARNRSTSSQEGSNGSSPESWAAATPTAYSYPYDPVRDC